MYSMRKKADNISEMHNSKNPQYWIGELALLPHPEGGHFREVYRSPLVIPANSLSDHHKERNTSTSIYFLLQHFEFSAFHRLKSDEIWYYHVGDAVEIFVISPDGQLRKLKLGLQTDEGCVLQLTIPKDHWFAARTTGLFTLMSCNVSPGFDFEDFELARCDKLTADFPQHGDLIRKFTLY